MRTLSALACLLSASLGLLACGCEQDAPRHHDPEEFSDPPGVLGRHTQRVVLSKGAFTRESLGAVRSAPTPAGIQIAFHGDYSKGFRLWKAELPDAFVDVSVRGAAATHGVRRKDGGLVYFQEVFPGVTSVFGAKSDQVEEFFSIPSADKVPELVYDLSFGPGFAGLKQEGAQGEHLYGLGKAGELLFEIPQPVAFDATDKAWQGSWGVETAETHATLRVKLDLSGASYPVLLDPAFVQPQWVVHTSDEPTGRAAPQSASGNSQALVFGGFDASGTPLDDARVFTSSGWQSGDRTSGTTRPTGRGYGAMVYRDASSNAGYAMFGGHGSLGATSELWTATLSSTTPASVAWTQVEKTAAQQAGTDPWPTGRFLHGMAEDTSTHDIYVAGGVDQDGNLLTDMWKGTISSTTPPTVTWAQLCASCVPARYGAAWVQVKYPTTQAGWFQFGGHDGTDFSNAVYQWNGSTASPSWTAQTISGALVPTDDDGSFLSTQPASWSVRPQERYVGYAFSDAQGDIYVGGGVFYEGSDVWLNDTWVWHRASGDNRWGRFAHSDSGYLLGQRESPAAVNLLSSTATGRVLVFGGGRSGNVLQGSRSNALTSTTAASAVDMTWTHSGGNRVYTVSSLPSTGNQEGYLLMLADGDWQEAPSGSTCGSSSSPVSVTSCTFSLSTAAQQPTRVVWMFRDKRYYYDASTGNAGSGCSSGGVDTETCNLKTSFPGQTTSVVRQIETGYHHTCTTFKDGSLKCWGRSNKGQLGQGNTNNLGDGSGEMGSNLATINLGTNRTVTQMSAGLEHNCAILDDGGLKCWGYNANGQLGLGDTSDRGDGSGEMGDNLPAIDLGTGRTAKAVDAGSYHTCALLDNGTVKCWGYNSGGQLGQGNTAARGDGSGEMGDNLAVTSLGTGRTAKAISVGTTHACAILDDGTVKCWGENANGQLGQGDTSNRGDGANEMGDSLPAVDLGTGRTAVAISAGYAHTCAVLDNGTLKCWGFNNVGQLGLGNTSNRGDGSGEMGDNLPAVSLGTGRTAVAISAGIYHTCVLLDDNTTKCWGMGVALGQGNTTWYGTGSNQMGDNLPAISLGTGRSVRAASAGYLQSCALLDDDSIKCWGWSNYGQLGYGDTTWRGNSSGQMGDSLPAVDLDLPMEARSA